MQAIMMHVYSWEVSIFSMQSEKSYANVLGVWWGSYDLSFSSAVTRSLFLHFHTMIVRCHLFRSEPEVSIISPYLFRPRYRSPHLIVLLRQRLRILQLVFPAALRPAALAVAARVPATLFPAALHVLRLQSNRRGFSILARRSQR